MIAAEALDQGPGASHRPQEDGTRPGEANRRGDGKKTEKKQEGLTPQEEEDAAKKTPPMPDFKPAESAEFQLGTDTHPLLSKSGKKAKPPLIVYKLHRPLPKPAGASNALWDTVAKDHPLNRIVVVSVEDLREMGAPISRGLSWERTATDVTWQLLNHPELKPLMDCPRLIIRLGESGAIYWQRPDASRMPCAPGEESVAAWLVYDPTQIEGSVQARFDQRGWMVGNGSAFVAGSELLTSHGTTLSLLGGR